METVVSLVTSLVSNLGFPIACVCVMFWQQNEERKSHEKESAAWVDALNRNTEVIQELLTKFGGASPNE